MAYNNELARRLVFDIETAPVDGAAEFLEPVTAPSNYKNPDVIASYVADKTAEAVGKCSLDPDLCRIVAIGWQREGEPIQVGCAENEFEEREALIHFWREVGESHLIGFNCLAFDLPVLFRRSLYLNVPAPFIQIDKYRHPRVTDLQMVLSYNGALRLRGLSFYCKRFGIEVPDAITGAGILDAVREHRWDLVTAHCQADIEKTARLAERVGVASFRHEAIA